MIKPRKMLADTAAVAAHYRVAAGTVRSWASRYNWTPYGGRRTRQWDLAEIERKFRERDMPIRWVIVRRNHGSAADELIADVDDRVFADQLCAELGEGHEVQPVEQYAVGTVRVVQTWQCRATVTDGSVLLAEPQRLAGAVQLVAVDTPAPWPERVQVDEEATRLETALGPVPHVVHLVAVAHTAERAAELVEAEAHRVADGG